jgi:uncharacterized membrane protein
MKQLENKLANIVPEEKTPSEDRLVMLCDGVFAIAITLLVIDIGSKVGGSNVDASLHTLIQPTISYLVTFLILAMYWRIHRNLMRVVQRLDRGFISLTFLFLAFIAFFPVTSRLLGNYGDHPAVVVIYTLTLSGCGFSACALWFYATWKHRLISPDLPKGEITSYTYALLFTPLIYCASLLLLFVVPPDRPYFICFSWALIGFAERIVKSIYKRWLEKPVQELLHHHPKDQNRPAADASAVYAENVPTTPESAEQRGM